jgi:DNA-binding transcriptional ArsR family regulator
VHLFAVLGDPVRFRVVEILASGSHLAGELTDVIVGEFRVTRSTVSHHLRILRDERVVAVEPDGNERVYRLRWNALERLDRALLDLYEKWDRRDGWPYRTDPLASPPRRHRLAERARHPVNLVQSDIEPAAPFDDSGWWDGEEAEEAEGALDGEVPPQISNAGFAP